MEIMQQPYHWATVERLKHGLKIMSEEVFNSYLSDMEYFQRPRYEGTPRFEQVMEILYQDRERRQAIAKAQGEEVIAQ